VLVTGAYGFAGSHFVEHAIKTTDWEIVALYSFRHKGCPLRHVDKKQRVKSIYHDLNGPITPRLKSLIGDIDYIVHLAAESHVERSIEDPIPFVQNNVNVSLNILEFARHHETLKAFVQVSTDEVYGPALMDDLHEEGREYVPSNPYAASKVAQEALATSYWRTYGLPLIITNTMNMIGPRQDAEKFVPMCVAKILKGETVTIHGTPENIGSRQYLHAKAHADAIIYLLNLKPPAVYDPLNDRIYQRPDRYNVVGTEEVDNLDLAQIVATELNLPLKHEFLDFHSARPGHDKRYALDPMKLSNTGWRNPFSLDDTIKEIVDYAIKHPEWLVIDG